MAWLTCGFGTESRVSLDRSASLAALRIARRRHASAHSFVTPCGGAVSRGQIGRGGRLGSARLNLGSALTAPTPHMALVLVTGGAGAPHPSSLPPPLSCSLAPRPCHESTTALAARLLHRAITPALQSSLLFIFFLPSLWACRCTSSWHPCISAHCSPPASHVLRSGYIGSHTVVELLNAGYKVVVCLPAPSS